MYTPYTESATVAEPTGGSTQSVGADIVGGIEYQRVKMVAGREGMVTDVAPGTAMAVAEDSITGADILHYLEALQNTDSAGRIYVDVATGALTSVTTVTTVSTVSNMGTFAGIGLEAFINQAEAAYYAQVGECLKFT